MNEDLLSSTWFAWTFANRYQKCEWKIFLSFCVNWFLWTRKILISDLLIFHFVALNSLAFELNEKEKVIGRNEQGLLELHSITILSGIFIDISKWIFAGYKGTPKESEAQSNVSPNFFSINRHPHMSNKEKKINIFASHRRSSQVQFSIRRFKLNHN